MGKKIAVTLACALLFAGLLAAAVAAPTLMFRAQDHALLSETHEYPTGTGTLEVPAEELAPVLATLYNREGAAWQEPNYITLQSKEELDELLPRVLDYTAALFEAGVLTEGMFNYITDMLHTRDTVNFTHYIENTGVEVITTNSGMGTQPPYYFTCQIDMNTDLVIGMEIHLPPEATFSGHLVRQQAEAWLTYLGLDMAGDWSFTGEQENWETPVEGDYAGGIATARGASDSLRMECYTSWYIQPNEDWEYAMGGVSSLSFSLVSYRNQTDPWWQGLQSESQPGYTQDEILGRVPNAPVDESVAGPNTSG